MSGLGPRSTLQPCVKTVEVHGHRGKDVLEVGFRLSEIAAAAQSETPNALRQRPLDAGAASIAFLPAFLILFQAAGLQGLMHALYVNYQAPGGDPPARC